MNSRLGFYIALRRVQDGKFWNGLRWDTNLSGAEKYASADDAVFAANKAYRDSMRVPNELPSLFFCIDGSPIDVETVTVFSNRLSTQTI